MPQVRVQEPAAKEQGAESVTDFFLQYHCSFFARFIKKSKIGYAE
jgi:hypothetical protein